MPVELFTVLAALVAGVAGVSGAVTGVVGTLLAAFLTNRSAADREREQRRYERQVERYRDGERLLAELYSAWWTVTEGVIADSPYSTEQMGQVTALATRVQLRFPALHDLMEDMTDYPYIADAEDAIYLTARFTEAARAELEKLEPSV